MTWDEVKELGPVYAIGGVDDETSRKIEEYLLDATPEQKSEIALWQEVAACLPGALHSVTPPAYLREHLLQRIADEVASRADELMGDVDAIASDEFMPVEQDEPSNVVTFTPAVRPEPSLLRWLPIAATILLAISSAYLLWQNNTLTSEKNALASELNSARERINNYVNYFTASAEWATMTPTGKTEASAKVVYDPKEKTMTIYVFGLPELPSDKDYQLWYISKNVPVSAAVFRTDSQGHVKRVDAQSGTSQDPNTLVLTLPYEVADGLSMMAVTSEPKGGSPKPTSDILIKGNIKGAI
ncbi:MAG: anti-sigma factor [Acidobacteria bacterium]|nr:anti-sigma factor [Acidobacteriota bacterium]